MRKNTYISLLAISLVIVIALLFVQDYADFLEQHADKPIMLGTNRVCDPARVICSASLIEKGAGKRISLSFNGVLKQAQAFQASMQVSGFDVEGISSIAMLLEAKTDADIKNTIVFKPEKEPGQVIAVNWSARAMLPAAPGSINDWYIIITLKTSEKIYRAEFTTSTR